MRFSSAPSRARRRALRAFLACTFAIAAFAAALPHAARAQPRAFRPPSAGPPTLFGYAVAATAERIAIGAPHATVEDRVKAGAVYVFDARSGALLRRLTEPLPGADHLFGYALAAAGRTVLVGAPGSAIDGLAGAGAAYVLDLDSGAVVQRLREPVPAAQDEFGSAVALPGGDALVGSPTTAVRAQRSAGAAYLFSAKSGGLLRALYAPQPSSAQNLGQSVGAAGERALIGAPHTTVRGLEHAGAAYLYGAEGDPIHTFEEPTPGREHLFAFAIAGDTSNVLIGAPHASQGSLARAGAAYLFAAANGALQRTFRAPAPDSGDLFGYAVALAAERVLVAAPHATVDGRSNAGAVFAFDAASGALTATLHEPEPSAGSEFGIALAAAPDALVGAQRASSGGVVGAAFLFTADKVSNQVNLSSPLRGLLK